MEELYKIANSYYRKMESFHAYGGFGNYYLYGILISGVVFLITIYFLLLQFAGPAKPSLFNWWFLGAIVSEIIGLLLYYKASSLKDSKITKSAAAEFGSSVENVAAAKTMILKNCFSCEATGFSKVSQEIVVMIERSQVLSNDGPFIEKFFSFVYHKDANQRILALFIVACSIITILAVNSSQGIYSVFEFYNNIGNDVLISVYLFGVTLLVIILIAIAQTYKLIHRVMIFIGLFFLGNSSRNIYAVKYMARDLNRYHVFNKTDENKIIIISSRP